MYRVRTSMSGLQGAPYLSTMFFDSSGGTAQNAADAVRAYWAAIFPSLSNGLTATLEPDVYTMDPANGDALSTTTTTTTAVVGGSSFDKLPFESQALTRWTTGVFLSSRQVRGRTFIPGCTESLNTNGVVDPGFVGTVTTASGNLIANGTSVFVIWHRPTPASPSSGSMVVVNGGTCWNQWAVLRSRRD